MKRNRATTLIAISLVFLIGLLFVVHSTVGSKLLMYASGSGRAGLVRLLLLLGGRVNGADENGGTALFYAAGKGHTSTVKLLVAAGAEVTAVDRRGNTALCYALRTKRTNAELVQLLIDKGALKKQSLHGCSLFCIEYSTSSQSYIEILLRNGVDINAADATGYTPLMKFAYDGNLNAVATLLQHGARINAISVDGKSALSEAVVQGNDELVGLLLSSGADPNIRIGGRGLVDIAIDQINEYKDNNPIMNRKYSRIVHLLSKINNVL